MFKVNYLRNVNTFNRHTACAVTEKSVTVIDMKKLFNVQFKCAFIEVNN